MDNVRVSVNIGGLHYTNEPVPIKAFVTNYENKDLQNGFVLPPNQKFLFRFDSQHLPGKSVGVMDYPLLASITLKGYEIPKTIDDMPEA